MFKRTVRSALLGMTLGAVVVGTTSLTAAAASPASDVTLTVMASQEWIKPAEQDLGKKFEEQTGIHVDYQIIPADQYFNVLKTKLNAGEATDIFGGQSGKSDLKLQYDVENNAVDLTGEEWTTRIDPAALDQVEPERQGLRRGDLGHHRVQLLRDGLQQGHLPAARHQRARRRSTSSRRPARPSRPPASPRSTSRSPTAGTRCSGSPSSGPSFEEAEPGLADKLNANKATFAGDANMTTAMTQINQLYQSGCFGDNALSDTFADTDKAMASGKYAMTVSQLSRAVAIEAAYPDVKSSTFGFFPIPTFDNQLQPVHPAGPTKFIYSKSPHVDAGQAVPGLPDAAREPPVPAGQHTRVLDAAVHRA